MSEQKDKIPHEFCWTDESIRDFWDYAANSVLMRMSFSKLNKTNLVQLIAKRISKEKTVFDFGAGSGDLVKALIEEGYKVGAFEPSEERRSQFAQQFMNNPNFLGFQTDRKYDCVICFEVLEHVTDESIEKALQTINDVLADDGVFIGSTPWDENLKDNYALCPACHTLFHRWQHMRSFSPETMAEFLVNHDFFPVEIFCADFTNSLIFSARKSTFLSKRSTNLREKDAQKKEKLSHRGSHIVSEYRFNQLNKMKYEKDLNVTEMEDYLSFKFYENFGYWPDLSNPKTYNEKLNWLKIHYHNPEMHIIADKSRFPTYILTKLPKLKEHCVQQLAIFHSPDEFTNDVIEQLPERFVLKSNFGSGAQLFIEKRIAAIGILRSRIAQMLDPRNNHYYSALEYGYKNIPPSVLCEPIIEFDYKMEFYCFDGEPFIYWIVMNDKTKDVCANIYSMSGQKLPVSWHYPNFENDISRPLYFDELVKISKTLSQGFPHVRVDFYVAEETWYFSEMTFYTWAGLEPFSDKAYDMMLGKKLILPKLEEECE